ncbi:MAG: hypothetical protein R3300_03510 [Candidatus Promineifilaceae bacterium]|nr:hypothetical protein [Candidatus Promineifilaceae bacterium]
MGPRLILVGSAAGTISALVFTILHGLMISNIWFMLVPMLIAGAVCGLLLGWSYVLLADKPSVGDWLGYNGLYLILLFALGPISLLVFEPVITIPALLASPNGLPSDLVREVIPLVLVYTVAMSATITLRHGRRWSALMAVLPATAALMALLGLNIAAMGLVVLSSGWAPMFVELLALIVTLDLVYALTFIALDRGWARRSPGRILAT